MASFGMRWTRRAFALIGVFALLAAMPLPAHADDAERAVTVAQSANLLSAVQAGFDGATGNWSAPGAAVAVATGTTHGGSGALAVTANAAMTNLVAVSGSGPATFTPVSGGARYTVRLWATAQSTGRAVAAAVVFFDGTGRTIATATGAVAPD